MQAKRPIVMLSIAGSDNTCGAGIQADIKTCQSLKAYCLNCITMITSQNSRNVYKILELPSKVVISQIKTLLNEYKVDCIKIGLINNLYLARKISDLLKGIRKIPIVVDPIYRSTTNKVFNKKKDYIMLNKILSEIKPIFTPNLSEVKILLKINEKKRVKISNILENFFENYKTGVVLTDVDVKGKFCIDYILDETKIVRKIKSQRIKSKNTHGTGCTFSSSLAIFLAKGFSLEKSTKLAKSFTRRCIFRAPDFGINYGPLGH